MFLFTPETWKLFFPPLEYLSSRTGFQQKWKGLSLRRKGKAIKLLFRLQLETFLNRIAKYSWAEYRNSAIQDSQFFTTLHPFVQWHTDLWDSRKWQCTPPLSTTMKSFPNYQYTFTSLPLEIFKQDEWNKTTTSFPIQIPRIRNLHEV